MAVAFDEFTASPTFSCTASEVRAVRRGKIAWADIDAMFAELFPAAAYGIPQLPQRYPGSSILYAESVNFKPLHPDGDQLYAFSPPRYTYAEAEITYKTIPYEQSDPGTPTASQIVTRRFSISGEFMTMKNRGIRWKGETTPIKDTEFQAGKIIPMLDASITLHQVTPAYYSSLRTVVNDLIGKINNATFEGAAAGTLLFLGGEFQQTVSNTGSSPWQVDLKFQQRLAKSGSQSVGWNWAWDDDTGAWREYETTSGDAVYPEGNFTTLY
jgi:hypothetical protein